MIKRWFPPHIAVKESIYNLPSGICFFNADGILRLCNRRMYNIFFELAGTDLRQLEQIESIVKENEIFELSDGTIWQFARSEIMSDNGESFIQYLASNVTELYQKQQFLQQKNIRLAQMYERQKALFDNINDIVREEETLALKIKVHDDLGRAIISMRHCLENNSSLEEIRSLAKNMQSSFAVLSKASDYDHSDTLEAAVESAQKIGVSVHIIGKTDNKSFVQILPFIVRECSTNCIRHAQANELYINITDKMIKVSDNGIAPENKIIEGGGLQNLRKICNKNSLDMTVLSQGLFEIIIERSQQ